MPPNAYDFEREIRRIWAEAQVKGLSCINIVSGDVHRVLGGYSGSNNRMPNCCRVMRQLMKPDDRIIHETPSGQSSTLTIQYQLPR